MIKKETQKGITLVSLVITVIILLILAGVAINLAVDGNKIFAKAKEAANKWNSSIASEGQALENIMMKANEITGTSSGNEPKEPTFTTVANKPDIDGFDKTKTYYVAWNENAEKTAYDIDEKNMSANVAPDNWYDYTSGINHWANVKTTGGGNDCYWVWIPRYAYKVPTKPTADTSELETIEVKFLQGESNIPIGETEEITNTTPTPGTWVVHPAFTTAGNGGFGELTGIWVAKFEASSSAVSEATELPAWDDGGGNVTNLQVRIKPNVLSWRYITVDNIFTVCRNLTEPEGSLENTNNLNSHMMKNTEWGAVAYLSMSEYGLNSEVESNNFYACLISGAGDPYYTGTNLTGKCGPENGYEAAYSGYEGLLRSSYNYHEMNGGEASASGNVYGVYDLAGRCS